MKELSKVKLLQTFKEKIKIEESNYQDMKLYEKKVAKFVDKEALVGIRRSITFSRKSENINKNNELSDDSDEKEDEETVVIEGKRDSE